MISRRAGNGPRFEIPNEITSRATVPLKTISGKSRHGGPSCMMTRSAPEDDDLSQVKGVVIRSPSCRLLLQMMKAVIDWARGGSLSSRLT